MEKCLAGKVVFLSGASSGIGRALAVKMAAMGASVVATTGHNIDGLNQTLALLDKSLDTQVHTAYKMDVTNSAEVNEVMKTAHDKYGRIDVLLNNAGVSTMANVEDITDEDWTFNNRVNSDGMFYVTRAAIPYLKETKGKIVNTASLASLKPVAFLAHYTASKMAALGLTQTVALELAKYGITCNCVCPGLVKTPMQDREIVWEAKLSGKTPEQVRADYISGTPLGRLCLPEDIANAVGFLVSPEADFITGVALPVTGGIELL